MRAGEAMEDLFECLAPLRGKLKQVDVRDTVPSTNDVLLEATPPPRGFRLCAADSQSAGRGRHGGTWHSPRGGIYLSLAHALTVPRSCIAGLGLLIAARLVERFNERGAGVSVKPPNDVVCAQGKLAGVLVETTERCCVMGVGVNWARPQGAPPPACGSFAYLSELTDVLRSRAQAAALTAACIIEAFDGIRE